jgi:adenine phosphoribosyltransferase
MEVLGGLESGEMFRLEVPGLGYGVDLPFAVLPSGDRRIRIASLNLVGQTRLNRDLGRLIAARIRKRVGDTAGVVFLTVVEKALMLAQAVADALGLDAVAVAYNRVKPHMEPERRPVIQVGASSVTSGSKFLALYERDINLIAGASTGIAVIDDVVSTGGTLLAVEDLLAALVRHLGRDLPPVVGAFCVAQEGGLQAKPDFPIDALTRLPPPAFLP